MTKPMPKGSFENHSFEVLEEDGTEVDEEEYFQVVLNIHIILEVIKSIIIVIKSTSPSLLSTSISFLIRSLLAVS